MANHEHLTALKSGVTTWNIWRTEHPEIRPNLCSADLRGAVLRNANLSGALLMGSDLRNADLSESDMSDADFGGANLVKSQLTNANLSLANFQAANLEWATLENAKLREAKFGDADLSHANLRSADLFGANLRGAQICHADLTMGNLSFANLSDATLCQCILNETEFRKATFGMTTFDRVDLSKAKGLHLSEHTGPSTLGIDTLFMSKGTIPETFLRGAGVPEIMIKYLPSLVGTGIEFYSLFISYSTADEEFAKRLHADLQAKGVRCWFAPHDMRSGKKVHKQIDEAIRTYDRLLLILSSNSIKSSWVETEISKARKREVSDKKQVLYPLSLCSFPELRDWECFDSDSGKDSAREIREYFIPDFSNWKDHDSYRKAFDELMKDLNKKIDPS